MKLNKIVYAVSALFLGFMIFLTIFARTIHNNKLQHVETIEIKKQDFICEFTDKQGELCHSKRRAIGIPKKYANENVFIINEIEVYGEKRKCALKVELFYFDDYLSEEYAAVSYGLSVGDSLIVNAGDITDGSEVIEAQ
jgi:hypothetical protein